MKTALKIVSIVYIPLLVLSVLISVVVLSLSSVSIDYALQQGSITPQDAEIARAAIMMAIIMVVVLFIPALVFDIVIMVRNNHDRVESLGGNITLGVFAIIFGAAPTGILWIVRSAVAQQQKNQAKQIEE